MRRQVGSPPRGIPACRRSPLRPLPLGLDSAAEGAILLSLRTPPAGYFPGWARALGRPTSWPRLALGKETHPSERQEQGPQSLALKAMREAVREFLDKVAHGSEKEATEAFHKVSRVVDRTTAKGVIHKNQAARRKSRMSKRPPRRPSTPPAGRPRPPRRSERAGLA